jgi:hypothetical protein
VASPTEPRDVSDLAAALRALHRSILVVAGHWVVLGSRKCAEVVNTGSSYRRAPARNMRESAERPTKKIGNATGWSRSGCSILHAPHFAGSSHPAYG